MRVFRYPYDFKISRMLHIVTEVLTDRMAVFEILLLKKPLTTATLRVVGMSSLFMARPSRFSCR